MTRPLPAEIEEVIDDAREYVQHGIGGGIAEVIVQLADACVVGLSCERHGGAMHGREAEELRAGIEKILEEYGPTPDDVSYIYEELRRSLQRLLDKVDARDSLAFLEAADGDACHE